MSRPRLVPKALLLSSLRLCAREPKIYKKHSQSKLAEQKHPVVTPVVVCSGTEFQSPGACCSAS